jgi:hypothetical protein
MLATPCLELKFTTTALSDWLNGHPNYLRFVFWSAGILKLGVSFITSDMLPYTYAGLKVFPGLTYQNGKIYRK